MERLLSYNFASSTSYLAEKESNLSGNYPGNKIAKEAGNKKVKVYCL